MKLDVLAFAAHPDDVELGCSGILLITKNKGGKTGIVDLTRGELGTRGTPEIRAEESAAASKILDLDVRENLGFRDGFFLNDEEHQMQVIRMIRKYQPEIVIANAPHDRHRDHRVGSNLLKDSVFLAGLAEIKTEGLEAWRPKALYYYVQDRWLMPDLVVDISEVFEKRMECIEAYKSQFFDPESDEPETYISSEDFKENIVARAREMGRLIFTTYGEGLLCERTAGVKDIRDLI